MLEVAAKVILEVSLRYNILEWYCESDFKICLCNIVVLLCTEWMPYIVIFILHYSTFRTIN